MFWADEYLNRVASQIRVKRAREPLMGELRDHLECQREAYLADGMEEAEAQSRAIANMGDALLVGGELDRVHRPRMQWKGMMIALFLIVLGLLIQRLILPLGAQWLDESWQRVYACVAAGLVLLLAMTDYTLWMKLTLPVFLLWSVFWIFRMGFGSKLIYAMGWPFRYYFWAFSPECVALAMPLLLAFVICRLRSRGWGALVGCATLPAMTAILSIDFQNTTWAYDAIMLLACTGFGVLFWAVCRGFFQVKRKAALVVFVLCIGLTFAGFVAGAMRQLRVQQPYLNEMVYPMLKGAKLLGLGAAAVDVNGYEFTSVAFDNAFLAVIIHRFGWIPFLLFTGGLIALLVFCFVRFARMENRMGALLGLTATATLALQFALYYLDSFTNYLQDLCLPLVSYGNMALGVDAIIVGVILSVLRSASVPEA